MKFVIFVLLSLVAVSPVSDSGTKWPDVKEIIHHKEGVEYRMFNGDRCYQEPYLKMQCLTAQQIKIHTGAYYGI